MKKAVRKIQIATTKAATGSSTGERYSEPSAPKKAAVEVSISERLSWAAAAKVGLDSLRAMVLMRRYIQLFIATLPNRTREGNQLNRCRPADQPITPKRTAS